MQLMYWVMMLLLLPFEIPLLMRSARARSQASPLFLLCSPYCQLQMRANSIQATSQHISMTSVLMLAGWPLQTQGSPTPGAAASACSASPAQILLGYRKHLTFAPCAIHTIAGILLHNFMPAAYTRGFSECEARRAARL